MISKTNKDKKKEKRNLVKKKKKKALPYRLFFKIYLDKAGIDKPLIYLRERLLYFSIAITVVIFLYLIIKSIVDGMFSIAYFFVELFLVVPATFVAVAVLLIILFVLYIDVVIYRRKVAIEAVLPDFLQLAAANVRSGMTIDRALWTAIRPQFGVLAKEVELVAKQTMSGEELDKALVEFGKKYDSPVLMRTINLIVEGVRAGGELGSLLERISLNLQKSQSMQKEMAANVTSYVMFISFATVVIAPMLYGLSLQLIDITGTIMGNMDLGSASSGSMPMQIGGGTSISRGDFIKFAIAAISVTSFFSACIISMIQKGNIKSGLRSIPIFVAVSVTLFFVASWILGTLFKGVF